MSGNIKIALQAAMVVITALAVVGGASLWMVETLIAAELKPLEQRVVALEQLEQRSVLALESIQTTINQIATRQSENSTDIEWIKKFLQRQKLKID